MTNNKIKMNKKNNPTQEQQLHGLIEACNKGDAVELLSTIIELDDNTFSLIEDKLNDAIDKSMNSIEYKNHAKQQLAFLNNIDYEKEKEGYEKFLKELEELDISEQKRALVKKIMDIGYETVRDYSQDPSKHIVITYQKLNPDAIVPNYAHAGDAGADLYAIENIVIDKHETKLIGTGIALAIPKGYEGQIRPRSGISLKTNLRISNTPGTIDSNYRGEIKIIATNIGETPIMINKNEKVAQIVFNEVPIGDFIEGVVETTEDNTRGEKGFGSSDIKNE